MKLRMLLVSAGLLVSCSGYAQKPEVGPLATLERRACFGFCPVYSVEIRIDGSVTYDGREYVVTQGTAAGMLDAQGLRLLREAFQRTKFRDLRDDCCSCYDLTDQPYAVITLVDGQSPQTIVDYHGCEKTPESLRTLEGEIDRIVAIEQWIGTEEQRLALWRNRR